MPTLLNARLGQVGFSAGDFVLQRGGEVVDIGGGDVDGCAVKERNAAAADRFATHLNQESLHHVWIKFFRSHANEITEGVAYRHRCAVGTGAGHGVERIGNADDAHLDGKIGFREVIGISGAVAALVMPTNGLGDLWPGELHAAHDMVTQGRVIGHLAEFIWIERPCFAKEASVDGDFTNVVEISGAAESGDFAGIHA